MSTQMRFGVFIAAGLVVAVLLAFLVAPQASSQPDGLEKVAADEGIDGEARDHDLADAPTADYGIRGVDDEGLGTGLAGLLGIVVVFAVTGGLFLVVRRTRSGHPEDGVPPAARPTQSADA